MRDDWSADWRRVFSCAINHSLMESVSADSIVTCILLLASTADEARDEEIADGDEGVSVLLRRSAKCVRRVCSLLPGEDDEDDGDIRDRAFCRRIARIGVGCCLSSIAL